MIAQRAYKYCREDLSLVENYAEAMADQTQVWHARHSAGMMGHKVTAQAREHMRLAALRREANKRALKEVTNA